MPDANSNNRKTELFTALDNLRKNEKQMELFVKELEGGIPNKGEDTFDFCKRYIILIFQKYCHCPDDRELMLASCGLLQGEDFHAENMEDRIIVYWQYAQNYNSLFKRIKTPSSAIRKGRTEMNRIMDYLVEDLIEARDKNDKKLGHIDQVPKILILPEPRIMKEQSTEEVVSTSTTTQKIDERTISIVGQEDIENPIESDNATSEPSLSIDMPIILNKENEFLHNGQKVENLEETEEDHKIKHSSKIMKRIFQCFRHIKKMLGFLFSDRTQDKLYKIMCSVMIVLVSILCIKLIVYIHVLTEEHMYDNNDKASQETSYEQMDSTKSSALSTEINDGVIKAE